MSPPPPLAPIITAMLDFLRPQIPGPSTPLSDVSIVRMKERSVGLGNRRGVALAANFGIHELKGLRLEATVRFQLWAPSAPLVEVAAGDLNNNILTNRNALTADGFLLLNQGDAQPSSFLDDATAWRKLIDYDLLYEHRYQDSDDALSLIVRIPIHGDPETRNSPQRETNIVTDSMVRWDREGVPDLVLRGRSTVATLSMLLFTPAGAAAAVTVLRTHDGASGPPLDLSAQPFADFLDAITDPDSPLRHGVFVFPSLGDFRDAFDPSGDPVTLGDWNLNTVPDSYQPRTLSLNPPVRLTEAGDRLEIRIAAIAGDEVVYLKAN